VTDDCVGESCEALLSDEWHEHPSQSILFDRFAADEIWGGLNNELWMNLISDTPWERFRK